HVTCGSKDAPLPDLRCTVELSSGRRVRGAQAVLPPPAVAPIPETPAQPQTWQFRRPRSPQPALTTSFRWRPPHRSTSQPASRNRLNRSHGKVPRLCPLYSSEDARSYASELRRDRARSPSSPQTPARDFPQTPESPQR